MILDFDQWCIVATVFLSFISIRRYRPIAVIISTNFILFELSAQLLDALNVGVEDGTGWKFHAVYIIITGLTIKYLRMAGAYWFVYISMLVFALLNFIICLQFQFKDFFIWLGWSPFDSFATIARFQMAAELSVMFLISRVARYGDRKFSNTNRLGNYTDRIDSVLLLHSRMGSRKAL